MWSIASDMPDRSPSSAEYWNRRASEFGDDLKTLAYGSRQTQERKFDILISAVAGKRISVLDVGCGFGDLYFHMVARGFELDYCGVDISASIAGLAKERHPELRIVHGDLLGEDPLPGETFDYVLSTGINCARHERNHDLERAMLRDMFSRSTRAAAMGLQSAVYLRRHPEKQSPDSWYSDPAALCEFALNEITPWVTLRHDYMPHDFTLFLFHEPVFR